MSKPRSAALAAPARSSSSSEDSFTEVWGEPPKLYPCRACRSSTSFNDGGGPVCGTCFYKLHPDVLFCA